MLLLLASGLQSVAEAKPAGTGQISLGTTSLNFGNVLVNTIATQTISLKAIGSQPVTINSATVIGAGFSVSGATFPVKLNPKQTLNLQVSFDPTVAGSASGTVTFSSNSNCTDTVALSGTGTSPQLTVSPGSLAFGNVILNTTSTQTLTLTSSGTAPVTVNSATLAGNGFTVSGATFPATLNPGQTLCLQVSFSPTAAGSTTGTVTISSNSSTGSTANLTLSGTGTSPRLTVSSGTLAFGNVTLNSASTQALTLTSSGTAPVTVNSAALAGTGFTVSGATLPATLNPGQTLCLQVSFSPTAAGSTTGTVTISSNSSAGTIAVGLSGTGTNPTNPVLTLSTMVLSFGDDPVGTPISLPVTLTSTGSTAVTVSAASLTGTGFTFSGAVFPVTLNPTIAITIQVQFDPTAAGTASGTLVFSSNSTTDSTSVVNLNGNGTAIQHQVSLSWNAPSGSPVPVIDYNIYRAAAGSSSYQILNSSSNPTFVDSAVQTNTVYSYYVTSVGNDGTESAPSTQVTVTVP